MQGSLRSKSPSNINRRNFLGTTIAAGAVAVLPGKSEAFLPALFTIVRFGIGAVGRGSVTQGSVIALAAGVSGAGRAFASTAPRLAAPPIWPRLH